MVNLTYYVLCCTERLGPIIIGIYMYSSSKREIVDKFGPASWGLYLNHTLTCGWNRYFSSKRVNKKTFVANSLALTES